MRALRLTITAGLVTLALLIAAISYLFARQPHGSTPPAPRETPFKNLAATPENLRYLGLDFTPIVMGQEQSKGVISEDQAIAKALDQEPELRAANGTSAMLGFLRNPNLQQAAGTTTINGHLADMGLVWLITFHGIQSASSGPAEAPKYISDQYILVIDAKTGKYVMAFPLFDVTPNAIASSPAAPTRLP